MAAVALLGGLVPAAPSAEGERCLAAGKAPAPPADSLQLLLADVSLRCEVVDTSHWEPRAEWAPTEEIDGIPGDC